MVPPVTIAAARKGPAFDRSGSMSTMPPRMLAGVTRHVPWSVVSTMTPLSRNIETVMSMCGCEGSAAPR